MGDGPRQDPRRPQEPSHQRRRPQMHPALPCRRAAAHRPPCTVQERVNARVISPVGWQALPTHAGNAPSRSPKRRHVSKNSQPTVSQSATARATHELAKLDCHLRQLTDVNRQRSDDAEAEAEPDTRAHEAGTAHPNPLGTGRDLRNRNVKQKNCPVRGFTDRAESVWWRFCRPTPAEVATMKAASIRSWRPLSSRWQSGSHDNPGRSHRPKLSIA